MARVKKPLLRRHSPRWLQGDWEAPSVAASRTPSKEEMKPSYWMKRDMLSRLQVKTPERPFFKAYCINSFYNVFKL